MLLGRASAPLAGAPPFQPAYARAMTEHSPSRSRARCDRFGEALLGKETVDPSLYTHITGTTDSEVLFHLALTAGPTQAEYQAGGAGHKVRPQCGLGTGEAGDQHAVSVRQQQPVHAAEGAGFPAIPYAISLGATPAPP